MKPLHTTLMMGLLAVVCCGTAATFFPWNESEKTTETATKLFDEFENQVWAIKISRYDRETEGLKSIALRRKLLKWIIPAKSNFVATGRIISEVENCLNEKEILGEQSEDQQDHEKYGVLDPLEYIQATNRDSVGVKLTLEDVNRTVLGSLIVGDKVRDTLDHFYVRKPGQPKIYIIKFNPEILSTAFGSWLDSNILDLKTPNSPEGATPSQVKIQNYRLSSEQLSGTERDDRYRAYVRLLNDSIRTKVELPGNNGWKTAPQLALKNNAAFNFVIQEAIRGVPSAKQRLNQEIHLITDAGPKEEKLAEVMSTDINQLTSEGFLEAADRGFRLTTSDNIADIDGTNGELTIQTEEGVEISMVFGNLAPSRESASNALNYYMLITARVMDSILVEPSKPTPPTPPEGEELSEEASEQYAEILKDHANALKQWKNKLDSAAVTTEGLNSLHGKWYYIINEDILKALRPEVATKATENTENASAKSPKKTE